MTPELTYFSSWRSDAFACAVCGWAGDGAGLEPKLFSELFELRCPTQACESLVAICSFPTEAELMAAAARGDSQAVAILESRGISVHPRP